MTAKLLYGVDVMDGLRQLPDESVHCIVTSPPYWALRCYGVDGQLGLEDTPHEYLDKMTAVFREARRVLKSDGTLWLNMGDSYNSKPASSGLSFRRDRAAVVPKSKRIPRGAGRWGGGNAHCGSLKPKDLIGMPWRLAFALQDDGWYLRADIIWAKPNPMPESVRDRPTKSHEYIFLLTKSGKYFYDKEGAKEPVTGRAHARGSGVNPKARVPAGWDTGPGAHTGKQGRYSNKRYVGFTARYKTKQNESFSAAVAGLVSKRNMRTVWPIPTEAFKGAHFATFPKALAAKCIKAGCPQGGVVADIFSGSATVGEVALGLARHYIGIDINPEYEPMARARLGLFAQEASV